MVSEALGRFLHDCGGIDLGMSEYPNVRMVYFAATYHRPACVNVCFLCMYDEGQQYTFWIPLFGIPYDGDIVEAVTEKTKLREIVNVLCRHHM